MKYSLSGVAVGVVLAVAVPGMAQTPLSPSTPLSTPAAAQPPSTPTPSTASARPRPAAAASHRPVRRPLRATYAAAGDHSANRLNGQELGRIGAAPPAYPPPPYPPVAYAPPYPPPVYAPPPYAYPPPWGYYRPHRWGWRGYYW